MTDPRLTSYDLHHMRVAPTDTGGFDVVGPDGVLTTCRTHSEAWKWIDRQSGAANIDADRNHRIRTSDRFK